MSPRADEHEGPLNDSETKKANDKANARALEILRNDALGLTEAGHFLRFFSRYAYPALAQNFPVNSGSELAKFMGRRELVLEMIDALDKASPGFIRRMLEARDDYQKEIQRAAQGPQEEQ